MSLRILRHARLVFASGAMSVALTACDNAAPPGPVPVPQERPAAAVPARPPAVPVVAPVTASPNAESRDLAVYYRRLEADLVAQGLLRTDGGGPDTPYTDAMLARNFVRIALFDEYRSDGVDLRPQTTASRLRRWNGPVRMGIEFGASIPESQRTRDRAEIARYADRLSRLTGLTISTGAAQPNFHVLVLNENDRDGYSRRIRQLVPGIADSSVRAFMTKDRSTLCLVLAFSEGGSPSYSRAVALIRGEHPDLLRRSCIHEELAQGLGLANDSPQVRPSIFNDDEEFGLLTTHDEMLLRMLYDPRMRPGMTVTEAAPVARVVARELMGTGG